jgi:3-deoxy-D-manno-octulosonic-acid transferase
MRFFIYFFYQLIIFLASPFFLIRLWRKGKSFKGYRKNWCERFGFGKLRLKKSIWIHAVSVGETVAASILVRELVKKTDLPIVITTMTPTGKDQFLKLFKDQKNIYHSYIPYDFWFWIIRFIKKINPKILIIMETELWPVLLNSCAKKNIPVILSNARMSEKSYKKYAKFQKLSSWMLQDLSKVLARTDVDANYFKKLGVDDSKLKVVGNLKYDICLPDDFDDLKKNFKASLGIAKKNIRPIWVAASTHEGEEEQIIYAHKKICEKIPNALLVLVPRHPNRFNIVADLIRKQKINYIRKSDNKLLDDINIKILLGDSMGDLLLYYSISDVAFIGGSLVPVGGHNILEGFSVGVPVIVGDFQDNFLEMSKAAKLSGALKIINNKNELALSVCEYLNNNNICDTQINNEKLFLGKHRGASENNIKIIMDEV